MHLVGYLVDPFRKGKYLTVTRGYLLLLCQNLKIVHEYVDLSINVVVTTATTSLIQW